MHTISVPIIIRNCVSLKYPLDRVVKSVVGLASEVIIVVDPLSSDDSVDYCYDLLLEVNSCTHIHGTEVKLFDSVWDLSNVSSTGAEFARQTNIAFNACTKDWILSLQSDEAVHEKDFNRIKSLIEDAENSDIDAFSMVRLYFYGDINTIREDWTVPIIRLFKRGTRISCGDAMNTSGTNKISFCDVPIYHYSRIGDPSIISKRILSLDKFFHRAEKLLTEEELEPYDFSTHNFDCMHKEEVNVGREKVKASFKRFTGTHPKSFVGYCGV